MAPLQLTLQKSKQWRSGQWRASACEGAATNDFGGVSVQGTALAF